MSECLATDCEQTEEWRPIQGYESQYEVSSLGRVRSLPRPKALGGIRKLAVKPNGYLFLQLWRDGVLKNEHVHRLVASAFCPQGPGQNVVRHLDGNQVHNCASNLAWGTSSANNFDTVAHGNHYEARKTECDRGHAYDEANTGYRRNGRSRYCRACLRENGRRYYAARRGAAA